MTRRPRAAFAIMLLALAGCATTLDVGTNDPVRSTDAAIDDAAGSPVDEAACGVGSGVCRPGVMCSVPCADCFCNDRREWHCNPTCADPSAVCPGNPPKPATPCAIPPQRCTYPGACFAVDSAYCIEGQWFIFRGSCPAPPPCPAKMPSAGDRCGPEPQKCQWKNACGVIVTGVCTGTTWMVDAASCPSAGCPPTAPTSGSRCEQDTKCAWKNACGTLDFGYCSKHVWTVDVTCDPPKCPDVAPIDGSKCSTKMECKWPNDCAGADLGACVLGKWQVRRTCL